VKTFADSGTLVLHKRTHTHEKPYACNFAGCKKSFASSSDRSRHMCIHTGKKPYVCNFEDCRQAFSASCSLTAHKRTHTQEKPHICDVPDCGRAFLEIAALRTHQHIHSGQKPYICDFKNCGKSFSTSSGRASHKRSCHSDEKPFQCDHCSHRAKHKSDIQRHIKKHEIQRAYEFGCKMQDGGDQQCGETDIPCSIRTKTARDMDVHIERNHTVEGIGKKLQSETKLAEFLKSKDIAIERDWMNYIKFTYCKNIQGDSTSARPDFFLSEYSALLNAIVLIGNDEFGHRQYPCDLKRVFNIVQALQQTKEFTDVPILYIRFNPHGYHRDGVYYSHSLAMGHEILLCTLQNITAAELKRGLNLVYIHYDQTDGELDIFKPNEENNYGEVLKDCVLLTV